MHSIKEESPSDLSPRNAFAFFLSPLLPALNLFLAIRGDRGPGSFIHTNRPWLARTLQCGDCSKGPLRPDLGRKDDICHSVFLPASRRRTCEMRPRFALLSVCCHHHCCYPFLKAETADGKSCAKNR